MYIRDCTWARPTMRARTELFIPAGDSVSLVSFSFSAVSDERRGLLFPRLSSFLFFYLHFFRMYNLAKRKSGRLVGEIFWRFFEQNHFFDFSRESSPSNNGFLGWNFYLSKLFCFFSDHIPRKFPKKRTFSYLFVSR